MKTMAFIHHASRFLTLNKYLFTSSVLLTLHQRSLMDPLFGRYQRRRLHDLRLTTDKSTTIVMSYLGTETEFMKCLFKRYTSVVFVVEPSRGTFNDFVP